MRTVLLLLLLANLTFFGYTRLDSAGGGEAVRLAEQVQPDKIKLLTPQQVAALGPGKVAALADVCVEFGPLSDAERAKEDAKSLEKLLADTFTEGLLKREEKNTTERFNARTPGSGAIVDDLFKLQSIVGKSEGSKIPELLKTVDNYADFKTALDKLVAGWSEADRNKIKQAMVEVEKAAALDEDMKRTEEAKKRRDADKHFSQHLGDMRSATNLMRNQTAAGRLDLAGGDKTHQLQVAEARAAAVERIFRQTFPHEVRDKMTGADIRAAKNQIGGQVDSRIEQNRAQRIGERKWDLFNKAEDLKKLRVDGSSNKEFVQHWTELQAMGQMGMINPVEMKRQQDLLLQQNSRSNLTAAMPEAITKGSREAYQLLASQKNQAFNQLLETQQKQTLLAETLNERVKELKLDRKSVV